MKLIIIPKSLLLVLSVLFLITCPTVLGNPLCSDFYWTKPISSQQTVKPSITKEAYSRLLGLFGRSSDPHVNQFMSDLRKGWKGDRTERLETILPLFKRYVGKLTAEQYLSATLLVSKMIVSPCDFCTIVGFKAIVESSHDYELTSAQISQIRQSLQNTIKKINWNDYTNHQIHAEFYASYSPIGKHQSKSELKINPESTQVLKANDRLELYQRLGTLLGDQYEGYALRRMGQKGIEYVEVLTQMQKVYSKYIDGDLRSLIVDPGLATRFEDLVRFLNRRLNEINLNNSDVKISPWALRKEFSDLLGKKTMYRALALSEDELAHIMQNGLESIFLRSGESSRIDDYFGGSNPFVNPLQLLIDFRTSGPQLESDPFLSISSDPQVAIAATIPYFKRRKIRRDSVKIYLFEIQMPELDMFRRSESPDALLKFGDPPNQDIKFVLEDSRTKEKRSISRNDAGFEVFVDLKISKSEIVRTSEVNLNSFPNIGYWTINGKKPRGDLGRKINFYELNP